MKKTVASLLCIIMVLTLLASVAVAGDINYEIRDTDRPNVKLVFVEAAPSLLQVTPNFKVENNLDKIISFAMDDVGNWLVYVHPGAVLNVATLVGIETIKVP